MPPLPFGTCMAVAGQLYVEIHEFLHPAVYYCSYVDDTDDNTCIVYV
jgi:hypothetical protein